MQKLLPQVDYIPASSNLTDVAPHLPTKPDQVA